MTTNTMEYQQPVTQLFDGNPEHYGRWNVTMQRQAQDSTIAIFSPHFLPTTITLAQTQRLQELKDQLAEFQVEQGNQGQLQFQGQEINLLTKQLDVQQQEYDKMENKIKQERALGVKVLNAMITSTTGSVRLELENFANNIGEHPALNACKAFNHVRTTCFPQGTAKVLQETFKNNMNNIPALTSVSAINKGLLQFDTILQQSAQTRDATVAHHASTTAAIQARILGIQLQLNGMADGPAKNQLMADLAIQREVARKANLQQVRDNTPAITAADAVEILCSKLPTDGLLNDIRLIAKKWMDTIELYTFTDVRKEISELLSTETYLSILRQQGGAQRPQNYPIMTTAASNASTTNNHNHWVFADKPHIQAAALQHMAELNQQTWISGAQPTWVNNVQYDNNDHDTTHPLDNDPFLQGGKTAGISQQDILAFNRTQQPFIQPPPRNNNTGRNPPTRSMQLEQPNSTCPFHVAFRIGCTRHGCRETHYPHDQGSSPGIADSLLEISRNLREAREGTQNRGRDRSRDHSDQRRSPSQDNLRQRNRENQNNPRPRSREHSQDSNQSGNSRNSQSKREGSPHPRGRKGGGR